MPIGLRRGPAEQSTAGVLGDNEGLALAVSGLTKSFGKSVAVRDVSFENPLGPSARLGRRERMWQDDDPENRSWA